MKKILLILVIIGLMAASAVLAGCTSCAHNLKYLDESDYSGGGQIERTFPAPLQKRNPAVCQSKTAA